MTPHNIPAQDRALPQRLRPGAAPVLPGQAGRPQRRAPAGSSGACGSSAFMDAAWKHGGLRRHHVRPDLPAGDAERLRLDRPSPTATTSTWSAACRSSAATAATTTSAAATSTRPTLRVRPDARPGTSPTGTLPTWYGGMPADRFRLEQYLSFMNNLQGMFKPPDHTIHRPSTPSPPPTASSNRTSSWPGWAPIFTTMPVTRPPVAVLYSLSQNLHAQTKDMKDNYVGGHHGPREDAHHLPRRQADPPAALPRRGGGRGRRHPGRPSQGRRAAGGSTTSTRRSSRPWKTFAANGGAVLVSDDCKVQIKGAVQLGCPIDVAYLRPDGQGVPRTRSCRVRPA